MGKTKNKMQQKLQTILFFTFLICVQISYINSLKIKSKFKSQISNTAAANVTTAASPVAVAAHHTHHRLDKQDLINNALHLGNETNTHNHNAQFHIHHVVPRNLTNINEKVRSKLDRAREELGELNDVQKEGLEARLFMKFPKKPIGVQAAAIIDLKKGKVDEQSMNFNLTSVKELADAVIQGNLQKTRTVTVDGMTFKMRKIGLNFFYGGIVGKGGIGGYLKDNYLICITHNQFIGFDDFAYFFGQVIEGLKDNKEQEKFAFFKDNFEDKKDDTRRRLRFDKNLYNKNHGTQ